MVLQGSRDCHPGLSHRHTNTLLTIIPASKLRRSIYTMYHCAQKPHQAHSLLPSINRGLSNAQLPYAPPQQRYVNTDIRLANVVIGFATDWYPAYKTPLMIDFGLTDLATRYRDRDSKKATLIPVRYEEIGTRDDRPPVSIIAVLL
jgi:hypothetical protein